MKKIAVILAALAILLLSCTALAEETLAPPTDFTLDPLTGAFSFQAADENAGYYFVRVYPVVNGVEGDSYVASSKRINGKAGEKTGTLDMSGIGWGRYRVRLITFAASGTSYQTPEAVTLDLIGGVGGVLERPELRVVTDGDTAMFLVDWISCADYYAYQYLPEVVFTVYGDEACTQEVASARYDLAQLTDTMDNHPAGGYIWNFQMGGTYVCDLDNVELLPNVTLQLDAGAYWCRVQALSNDEAHIASSQMSDAVAFTITAEPSDGEYAFAATPQWLNPSMMGVPTAVAGSTADRVDTAASQETQTVVE